MNLKEGSRRACVVLSAIATIATIGGAAAAYTLEQRDAGYVPDALLQEIRYPKCVELAKTALKEPLPEGMCPNLGAFTIRYRATPATPWEAAAIQMAAARPDNLRTVAQWSLIWLGAFLAILWGSRAAVGYILRGFKRASA